MCARTTQQVVCWGGYFTGKNPPVAIPGTSGAAKLDENGVSCAILNSGEVTCWSYTGPAGYTAKVVAGLP
jgi:hypothetical protein